MTKVGHLPAAWLANECVSQLLIAPPYTVHIILTAIIFAFL